MDFTEAMKYIEEKNKLGQRPGLERIKELLLRLGNPQDKVKCLHIAGTNGKGSIFAFMQDVLMEAGYSVGRYISPTIFTYLERFQINGTYIDEAVFAGALTRVAEQVKGMEKDGYMSPTAFEIETAVAFVLFLEAKVDFFLVECGMGGLMDGTNVISNPYMTVMAQISRDHMQFLGDTLSEIAYQKAGIIKQNGMCVCASQADEVKAVIKKICEEKNTSLYCVNHSDINIVHMDIDGSRFLYKGQEYFISMPGDFQIINAATAIEAALQIGINSDMIRKAIAGTKWLGRFTVVRKNPYVIVDGAHNEAAWLSLKNSLHKYFTNQKFIYIIGVLRDKEYQKMVDIMHETMKYAVTVTPKGARGLENTVLSELITVKGVETVTADNNSDAMEKALAKASEDDVIVVCGSLSFIGEYIMPKGGTQRSWEDTLGRGSVRSMECDMDLRHMKRIDNILSNDSYKSFVSYIEEKEKNRKFCCHGMEHCLDVARIAYIISMEEKMGIDKELIYAAALLHDIGRAMEYKDGSPHHETGAEIAGEILSHADFNGDEIKTICHAIACHKSESAGNELCSLLYRADKLSRCCFRCETYDECYWDEDMKNKTVLY